MARAEGLEPGWEHLVWIQRFQFMLLPVGALLWRLCSRDAALAFLVGGLGSLVFWGLHRFLVARMLTPSLRRRWFYGLLTFAKLALIALLLHGMMERMPGEGLPLATGLLLFVAAILLEAVRLGLRGSEPPSSQRP